MKWFHNNRSVLLLTLVLMGLFVGALRLWWWSPRGIDGALSDLRQVAYSEVSVYPHFTGVLDLKSLRRQIQNSGAQAKGFLPLLYKQVGLAIPFHPSCPAMAMWKKSDSLVAMGFSGMRLLYLSLQGSFDAHAYMACMSKYMKRKRVNGQAMFVGDETYWWIGQNGSLNGMGINPRPPMFSFGRKQRLQLLGSQGLLVRTMQHNGMLRNGLRYRPKQAGQRRPYTGAFLLEGLEDMNLPTGIKIRFHRMQGLLRVNKFVSARISVAMRRQKHAMRMMGIYHLASTLAPAPLRSLLSPLKAKRKGRRIRLVYKEKVSELVQTLKAQLRSMAKKKETP
ncbi:MAG: hypothetical protein EP343_15575 [Deltaproteobacteria bacterium]|nr:MAG: hypothetical protein EP343_15575 [Deltaproteobacteria bacterium]